MRLFARNVYRLYLRLLTADGLELEASILYLHQSHSGWNLMATKKRGWAAGRVVERVQDVTAEYARRVRR
jgi:hypothetical protein